MKRILFLAIALISLLPFANSSSQYSNQNQGVYYAQNTWQYTKGWHSDGTSVQIRYNDHSIQVYYNGSWCNTQLYKDTQYNRSYVKTPANKRYYV